MVSLEQVVYVIPLLALTASITYYAMVLKNQNKARQVQMFMNLYSTYSSSQFRRKFNDITFNRKFENYADFWKKYGPISNPDAFESWTSVAAFFEGLGVLVKKEFIEIGLVHDFLGSVIIQAWEKMGPVFLESRKINNTKLWNEFEYLYNEIKKLE